MVSSRFFKSILGYKIRIGNTKIWKYIIILFAYGHDLMSFFTHPHNAISLHGKTQNVSQLSEIQVPI